MSLLSHGRNFGCFTRLRFEGACLLTTVRNTSYHIAKSLSGSVQFRTRVNGVQCRSVRKVVLLKCLKDRNDVSIWTGLRRIFSKLSRSRTGDGTLVTYIIIMCTYYALTNALSAYAQVRYIDLGDNVWIACVYLYAPVFGSSFVPVFAGGGGGGG